MPDLQIPEHEHYREAIDSVRKRVPVPRDVWDTMQTDERAHAFTVSQVARTQVLQQVLEAIDKAVTTGTAITDFRSEVGDKLINEWGGEIPGRLETIFRTNLMVAYSEGKHAINSAPAVKAARPYWRYNDTDNDRECDLCHSCHGVILPADHPFWNTHYAPLHHRCECSVDALSPEEAEEEGLTDDGDIPEVEADDGFGNQPSSEGKDWAPDLTNIDAELREALEAKLAEFKSQLEPERVSPAEPRVAPEAPRQKTRPRQEPEEAPDQEIEPVLDQDGHRPEVAKALYQHDEAHVDRPIENALILSPTGRTLIQKGGTRNMVGFTDSEFQAFSNSDAILSHNHPSGSSLSRADMGLAINSNAKEIRAVGRNRITKEVWIFSVNRPEKGWPTHDQVSVAWNKSVREVKLEIQAAVWSGRMTIDEANAKSQHMIWTRVQSKLDVGYRARKLK